MCELNESIKKKKILSMVIFFYILIIKLQKISNCIFQFENKKKIENI